MASHRLDATGLLCPLPVLRAQKVLRGLAAGEILTVTATDRAALVDIPAFCAATGHRLTGTGERDGVLWFDIERAG